MEFFLGMFYILWCALSDNIGFVFFPLKIVCNLLAVDGANDPDVLCINAGKCINADKSVIKTNYNNKMWFHYYWK